MPPRKPRSPLALPTPDHPQHPFDTAHGVDTSGLIAAGNLITGQPSDAHVTAYYGVAPSILRTLIQLWRDTRPPHPIERYTFVDFGSGKGRALLVASQLPFQNVIGIELNPTLAAVAQRNIDHWLSLHAADPTAAGIAPIRLYQGDALTFELPHTPTLAFLFHPFEAPVLKLLLRRIEARFAARAHAPAPAFDLLYVNSECRDVLDRHPAFRRLFLGPVAMSPEDHTADLAAIAQQKEYGSTGDEECAVYRLTGRAKTPE
ncbi:MAG: class I SAM-dependent methyltransferase [Acidobacteriota bacterium]|nr:class I SAM-dependent methyltransferase [Acidobacteriota bacterium]